MQKPLISLIVAVYKNVEALRLIFSSLEHQTYKNFEVIVAEDGYFSEITQLITAEQEKGLFPIKHVWQEDCGFRKNKILNAAISLSSADYCTFIDGDCMLHKHFLRDISKHVCENVVLSGRRVMLSEKMTEKLYRNQRFRGSFSYLNLIFGKCKHAEEGLYLPFIPVRSRKNKGILGCNMTISKKNLFAVNGFDEAYITPTVGEDVDIEWRLRMSGCEVKFMKFQSIVYHLHHDANYKDEIYFSNIQILREKQRKNEWRN